MLTTNRATLSFIQAIDFDEVLAMFHEPETFKYIAPLEGKTDDEYLKILKTKVEENISEAGFYWIARLKSNGEFVGAINLNPRKDIQHIQLGYQIRKKFWGQGFATELSAAVLEFAKNERQLDSVIAVFVESHIASRKILEKLGFQPLERRQTGVELLEVYQLKF
jgi:RimJ/RimL family protein N-acetyltransferase